jgi:uncharacterized RDD family membrane protein YckC
MSSITITTPFYIDLEFATASPGRRILAVITDMVILMLYMLILYRFVILPLSPAGAQLNNLLVMGGISILPFLYFPVCEILMNGQTPGKRLLGLKVIDLRGNEPGISQYLLRWLIGFGNYSVFLLPYIIITSAMGLFLMLFSGLFVIGAFYFPDFLCSLISKKNQRFADIAAGTTVINARTQNLLQRTIYLELPEERATAVFPQVMRLTDRDINGIRNLLERSSRKKADIEYKAGIAARIKEVLMIESDLDDTAFLQQLMRDYNLLTQQ